MAGKVKSWPGQYGKYGRSHLATQAVVLLPVMAIAGLSAWTIGSSAKGQSVAARLPVLAAITSQLAPAPAVVEANQQSAPLAGAPPTGLGENRARDSGLSAPEPTRAAADAPAWERWQLAPGLELHVSQAADARSRALADRLRDIAKHSRAGEKSK